MIVVRGKEYNQHPYDWYIVEALRIAPLEWTFEEVVCLRDAIREAYNHGHFISFEPYKDDAEQLRRFIRNVALTDPVATIRYIAETLGEETAAEVRRFQELDDD